METKAQLEQIAAGVSTAVASTKDSEVKIKALEDTIAEMKNLVADVEAKAAEQVMRVKNVDETAELRKEINSGLRAALSGPTKLKQATDLNNIEVKAVTIGGTDGEALAIDNVLGTSIIERARENVAILGLIGNKSVSSVDYREMVLRGYPEVGDGVEQVAGVNWPSTGTMKYEEVTLNVAKKYAKPFISDEAAADPYIDLVAELERLLAEEMSRTWAVQVLFGDGTSGNLRGLLSSKRIDAAALSGESYKDHETRDAEYYPVIATGVAGGLPAADADVIDLLIDITAALPTAYLGAAKWLMNRRTLAALRKLKDLEGRPYIQFEAGGFTLIGHPVALEDYMPDITAGSTPIVFGDVKSAYTLADIDDKFLVDPYSIDGAVQFKQTSRKGDLVQKNDAIVVVYVGNPA